MIITPFNQLSIICYNVSRETVKESKVIYMAWIAKNETLTQEEMENNADIVNNYFSGLGYDINTIAGILANLQNESRINPLQQEIGGGGGFGLIQWTPVDVLINACNVLGISPYTDGDNQLQVIDAQILGKSGLNAWYTTSAFISPYYNSGATPDMIGVTGEQFKTNSMGWTPDKLAIMIMVAYERPSYDPAVNHYDKRMADALNWYEYLTGHPPHPPSGNKQGKLPIWAYCRLF